MPTEEGCQIGCHMHLGPVAQRLEQGTHNPLVGGSNPSGPIDLRQSTSGCAAQGAAVDPENAPFDADLQTIIKRWAELPDAIKAGILAMVKMTGDGADG